MVTSRILRWSVHMDSDLQEKSSRRRAPGGAPGEEHNEHCPEGESEGSTVQIHLEEMDAPGTFFFNQAHDLPSTLGWHSNNKTRGNESKHQEFLWQSMVILESIASRSFPVTCQKAVLYIQYKALSSTLQPQPGTRK